MATSFDLVTIDAPDAHALAEFWKAALGLVEVQREDGDRWIVLASPAGQRRIGLQRGAQRHGGVHLDLACGQDELETELVRLVGLGASQCSPVRVEPYGRIVNLADPDGNRFDLCAYGS